MKNKIAFVSIGQAGGNIGGLFEKKGYPVLYLNTSKEDLEVTKGKYKYHIVGGEGGNKDRKKAKQLIIDDFDNIYKEISTKIEADLIYIIFASGGGTGSGSSPMLADLLLNEENKVGLITVLPAKDESIKTQLNAYECFKEIDELEGLSSCFILDNEEHNKMIINNEFINVFNSFITMPERHKDVRGNIDNSEIVETLSASGMAMIVSGSNESLLEKFDNNFYAPRENDEVIKYITASLSNNMEIKDIESKVGVPFDSFKTFNQDKTICCISGLSYPVSRLNEIYDIVNQNKDVMKNKLNATKKSVVTKDIDFFSDEPVVRKKKEEAQPSVKNKRDIMSKYLK